MSFGELERLSQDARVEVPESLGARTARTVRRLHRTRVARIASGVAAAVIVAAVTGITFGGRQEPRDSFSDPYLAYAELEKAFGRIGAAVSGPAQMVADSRKAFDITIDMIFNE